jgi:hypothetical protein
MQLHRLLLFARSQVFNRAIFPYLIFFPDRSRYYKSYCYFEKVPHSLDIFPTSLNTRVYTNRKAGKFLSFTTSRTQDLRKSILEQSFVGRKARAPLPYFASLRKSLPDSPRPAWQK